MLKNRFLKRRRQMERSRNEASEREIKKLIRPIGHDPGGPFLIPEKKNMITEKMIPIFELYRDKKRLNDDGDLKGLRVVKLINSSRYEPTNVDLSDYMPGLISVEPDPEHKDRVIISALGEIREYFLD